MNEVLSGQMAKLVVLVFAPILFFVAAKIIWSVWQRVRKGQQ